MAINPLVNVLLGAGEQFIADEDASDKLKGDIIDVTSKKYFDVELPSQKANVNAIKKVKQAVSNRFGTKIADAFDNYGYYEDGNIDNAITRIEKFIASTRDTEKTFRNKVENKMSNEDFKKVFGSTSLLGMRETALEERENRVNSIFADRSNVRDLLVSPGAPKEGLRGFLFGDRLKPSDTIAARGKLEQELEDRTPAPDVGSTADIFSVKTSQDDYSTNFLFAPATVYMGSSDEIAKAVSSYRGFSNNIQTGKDALGNTVITGMKFQGNKQLEYNALTAVMEELAPQYKDTGPGGTGKVNLTALARAADDKLTQQTENALGNPEGGIFVEYAPMSPTEKKAAGFTRTDLSDVIYKSDGFSEAFENTYQTDEDKVKALVNYISDLGDKNEQRFFVSRLPVGVMVTVKGQQQDLRKFLTRIVR
tara:strand:+ start:1629 stop:2894 length:1266 start_codon:yes stop_codon:yes gene_type:complete